MYCISFSHPATFCQ